MDGARSAGWSPFDPVRRFLASIPALRSFSSQFNRLAASWTSLTSPRKSHFQRLPAELIALTFDFLSPSEVTSKPICKSLVPYQRSVLFREIQIYSRSALKRLLTTLVLNPGLGSHCRKLEVIFEGKHHAGERQFSRLLKELAKVEEVWVIGAAEIGQMILSGHAASDGMLSRMSNLTMVDPFDGTANVQWNVESYKDLNSYPKLVNLCLFFRRTTVFPPTIPNPPTSARHLLSHITHFTLHNNIHVDFTPRFLQQMPHLEHLALSSAGLLHGTGFAASISAAPVGLKSLRVTEGADTVSLGGPLPLIDNAIQHLVNLNTLDLATSLFSFRLFDRLKNPLPLLVLSFSGLAHESLHQSYIYNILDPTSPTYNKHLRVVKLDVVNGRIGKTTIDDGLDEDGMPALSDWERPAWVQGRLDPGGISSLVGLGEETGVLVKGSAVDALDVDLALTQQEVYALAGGYDDSDEEWEILAGSSESEEEEEENLPAGFWSDEDGEEEEVAEETGDSVERKSEI